MSDTGYALGIDLGTTSIKLVFVDRKTSQIIASKSAETKANIDVGDSNKSEQCVSKILNELNNLLETFPVKIKQKVKYIGICGQMHGVVMWKPEPESWSNGLFQIREDRTTNLITWQDKRCDKGFLESLPQTGKMDQLRCGFGLPTLIWQRKHRPQLFQEYKFCATIEDLLVAVLTNKTQQPVISDQNASGWGFYDAEKMCWKEDTLKSLDFPVDILPKIQSSQIPAGKLKTSWSHIPEGCVVSVAAGDFIANVLSILYGRESDHSAVINISTSVQLTFVLPDNFDMKEIDSHPNTIEYRPYFGGRFLAAGCGLNAGNCLAFFVSSLKSWIEQCGSEVTEDRIWEILISEGTKQKTTDLHVETSIRGERYDPDKTGSVSNVTLGNMSLGHIMRGMCRGIIDGIEDLLPTDMLKQNGVKKIYTTGSALTRNKILQEEIDRKYKDFTIELCAAGDAAFGAAVMEQLKK